VTGAIVAVLVAMAFDESTRVSLWQSLLAAGVILGVYGALQLVRRRRPQRRAGDLQASMTGADV
jgi:uncharacterized protein YqfA (UPF0365 family)